ncbi:MAG: hypothetical protein KIT72_00270 [Polyangiaceae bacterium]|nr:hypothetical protein [Polyangiaceae bacterium]MCW5788830.1 hypothetical protein [Polyangiaceae bacterium]
MTRGGGGAPLEGGEENARDTIPDGLEASDWLDSPVDTIPAPTAELASQEPRTWPQPSEVICAPTSLKAPKPPRIHMDTPTFPMRAPEPQRKN